MDNGERGREFTTGDRIYADTYVSHDANIAGVRAFYRHESDERASLIFMEGVSNEDIQRGRDNPLPGPYLVGQIFMETSVPPDLPEGTYRLWGVRYITAGGQNLETDNVPEDTIRIKREPSEPPSVETWNLSRP